MHLGPIAPGPLVDPPARRGSCVEATVAQLLWIARQMDGPVIGIAVRDQHDRADIDHLIDLMKAEANGKGDDAFLPGAISLSADTYGNISTADMPMACKRILDGIRYRGIRVNVARARENGVMNRAEAGDEGLPFFDPE